MGTMSEKFTMPEEQKLLTLPEIVYLPFAEGTIDPTPRYERGEISSEDTEEMLGRIINGEYTLYGDPDAVPGVCMDVRFDEDGMPVEGAKAAGGTTTPVVADALTNDAYRQPGEKDFQHKKRVLTQLKKLGKKVGGHIPHRDSPGCGAEGKLDSEDENKPSILRLMVGKSAQVFDTLRSLGSDVTADEQAYITSKAQSLRDEKYATGGESMAQAGIDVVGEENLDKLPGGQEQAVAAVLMTEPGAQLDLKRLDQDFPGYKVFEDHIWAIANGAKFTSAGELEARQKNIAALAYNVATTAVIVSPNMPIVIV
jgi:hypothetical protein